MPDPLAWIVVAFLGAVTGGSEIIASYRDAPFRTLLTRPAIFYMCLNAIAALAALGLTRLFGWDFGVNSTSAAQVTWLQILAAGFAAMIILRSSLLTFQDGDQPVAVGPGTLLQRILDAVGRDQVTDYVNIGRGGARLSMPSSRLDMH
jgi:hypothetical protein